MVLLILLTQNNSLLFLLGLLIIVAIFTTIHFYFKRFLDESVIGIGFIVISLVIISFTALLLTQERELIAPYLAYILKILVAVLMIGLIMVFLPKRRMS